MVVVLWFVMLIVSGKGEEDVCSIYIWKRHMTKCGGQTCGRL